MTTTPAVALALVAVSAALFAGLLFESVLIFFVTLPLLLLLAIPLRFVQRDCDNTRAKIVRIIRAAKTHESEGRLVEAERAVMWALFECETQITWDGTKVGDRAELQALLERIRAKKHR